MFVEVVICSANALAEPLLWCGSDLFATRFVVHWTNGSAAIRPSPISDVQNAAAPLTLSGRSGASPYQHFSQKIQRSFSHHLLECRSIGWEEQLFHL